MRHASLLVLVLTACQTQIQHGLDEAQANEIETLLTEAGIEARKVSEGGRDSKWAIAVAPDRTTAAIKLLSDHDLPRQRAPGFGEVFGKGSMVPTAVEENALYVHALSGEMARTLSSVEGVLNARVHIVASTATQLPGARAPAQPRAAVLLKVRSGCAAMVQARTGEIQALVAGSVDGLVPTAVSVMISELPASPVLPAPPPTRPARAPLIAAALLIAVLAGALAVMGLALHKLRMGMVRNHAAGDCAGSTARTNA